MMNYKNKYLKYKNKYLSLKNQSGGANNILPRSLFQLLQKFVKDLTFETSIEVNKETDGTINLFLTKGFETFTDHYHESRTNCGIHIHTHPNSLEQRKETKMDLWPPSHTDILHSVQSISSHRFEKENNLSVDNFVIPENPIKKYDYVFDGNVLWYFKPNNNLIKEYLSLLISNNEEKKNKLLEIIFDNSTRNESDFAGLNEIIGFPKITLEEYLERTRDLLGQKGIKPDDEIMGIDIGFIDWKRLNNDNLSGVEPKNIRIPDDLTCTFTERRDKHIVLPEKDFLSKDELEILYQKALKIFRERELFKKAKGRESPF